MAWTPDGRFLCADTLADQLYVFDHDAEGLHRRRAFGTPLGRGLPDGSALDRDGFLWNCRVGGGALARFAPDGTLDRLIDLPCTAPTSCTFGGNGLGTLFVTSARFGLTDEQRRNPDEGALYALQPSVAGSPEHRFG
jgi:sugar lactone lactonase YvrE